MSKRAIHHYIPLAISPLPQGASGSYLDILNSIRKCFSVSSDYEFEALFIARFSIEIPFFDKGERISSFVLNKAKPQEYREPDEPDLSLETPGLPEPKSKMLEQLLEVIRSRMIDEISTPRLWKALINNPEYNNAFELIVESFISELHENDFSPRFVWMREIPECEDSPYPIRYHFLLSTDGTIAQSAHFHASIFSSLLSKTAWGEDIFVKSVPIFLKEEFYPDGVIVHPQSRTYLDEIAQVFHSVSDIALCRKPFKLPIGCLEFGRSDFPGWKPTLRALI